MLPPPPPPPPKVPPAPAAPPRKSAPPPPPAPPPAPPRGGGPIPDLPPPPPGPRQPPKLIYDFAVAVTPAILIERARTEGLHPYVVAYRMHDPLPWGFGQCIWIEEQGVATRKRLNIPRTTKLADEYGMDVLQTMCDFLNSHVPKFAIRDA